MGKRGQAQKSKEPISSYANVTDQGDRFISPTDLASSKEGSYYYKLDRQQMGVKNFTVQVKEQ